ncbi:alpha/beta hydrolase [Lewinella sp. IMCC34183]|uniref:alpha/beta hydrolase n=1 Tax=Lewinella sp. IMCC34183 TaxID=2248762 RepID=UPI000E275E33|nr:alpha/beta hydrolase [Lewinella sp. IMCC34183]
MMHSRIISAPCALLFVLLLGASLAAQDRVYPVYTGPVPCLGDAPTTSRSDSLIGRVVTNVRTPELHYYAPITRAAVPTTVVVIPGGGYTIEAWDLEGTDIARFLAAEGYHAFVLSHRLPATLSGDCRSETALGDAQEAMLRVRQLADSLGFPEDRVGIMGFSAGGHLAGSASVHAVERDRQRSRPDFSVLVYPVTLMGTDRSGHRGSQGTLLGSTPSARQLEYSNLPAQVDSLTPPTILFHASDDTAVAPANALEYYAALIAHGVPADLRIYATGGHGFGSARERTGPVSGWLDELITWLNAR